MDFVEKAKEIFGKGAEASKKAVSKAGNSIQEFSDKSVLKLDIKKLQSERKDVCSELGCYIYETLVTADDGKYKISIDTDEKLDSLALKIKNIDIKIAEKEEALSKFQEKSDSE